MTFDTCFELARSLVHCIGSRSLRILYSFFWLEPWHPVKIRKLSCEAQQHYGYYRFLNLAQYIEDLTSHWFFMSCRPHVSFVASITLGTWGGSAVLQLFSGKHLMVWSESTECLNTINCSLNHYTLKCCDLDLWETTTWSVVSLSQLFQS